MNRIGESGGGTVSLTRGLEAVRLLAEIGPLSASELSEKLAIRREAAERIVSTLLSLGFIKEASQPDRYLPGLVVQSLASRYLDSVPVMALVKPILHGISDRHRTILRLVVQDGNRALCLMQVGNADVGGQVPHVQRVAPLQETASGRIMQSLYDEDWTLDGAERANLLQQGYLVMSGLGYANFLLMPFYLGSTPAVLEVLFPANFGAVQLSELVTDLRAATTLIGQRIANAGLRAVEL